MKVHTVAPSPLTSNAEHTLMVFTKNDIMRLPHDGKVDEAQQK